MPRTRKPDAVCSSAYSSRTTPSWRLRTARGCSSTGSVEIASLASCSADLPARPRTVDPSARVTVIGRPMGRQPCDTRVCTATSPPSTTPTAPRVWMRPSTSRQVSPGVPEPPATPPVRGRPPRVSCEPVTNPSTGKDQGSASTTPTTSSPRRGGIPTIAMESDVRSTSRWNARISTDGRLATQTLTPGTSSAPCPPAITPWAVQPMTLRAPRTIEACARAAADSAGVPPVTKTQARSGRVLPSGRSAAAAARSTAATRSSPRARPSPIRDPAAMRPWWPSASRPTQPWR